MEPIVANGRLGKAPSSGGWYWFYEEGRPYEPQLYKVAYHEGDTLCYRRGRHGTPNNWLYHKQQDRIFAVEYIGERLPDAIMPKQSGLYWATARNGTRTIIQAICRDPYQNFGLQFREIKAVVLGSQYHYEWEHVVESLQLVRIDFIAPADEFVPRMRD